MRKPSLRLISRGWAWRGIWLGVAGGLMVTLALLAGACGPPAATPTPTEIPINLTQAQQAVARNRPAVVLITAVWSGDIVDKQTGQPVVNLVARYRGETQTIAQVPIPNPIQFGGFRGSGFIVSPDGYILTNAHVVYEKDEDVKQALMEQFVQWGAKEFPKYHTRLGLDPWPATRADVEELRGQVKQYFEVKNIKREVKAHTGKSLSGVVKGGIGIIADVRKVSPWEEKDIAVVKIEGRNLPTVVLGDSDKMREQDRVTVIGFPASPTLHPLLAEESIYESSVTAGIISARKKMPDGSTVLQTDATIVGGNSGGPAFNEQGEVIGLASFGTPRQDPREPPLVPGFNFLRPSNVAKQFLQEMGVQNVQGSTDEHYKKGLEFFWRAKYKEAIEEFEAVVRLVPGHAYAQDYIREAQEAISKGGK